MARPDDGWDGDAGSTMRKVLPWPSSLSSSMRPRRAPSRSVRCPPLWR